MEKSPSALFSDTVQFGPDMGELLSALDGAALERVTAQAIIEHRRLLELAEDAFEAMGTNITEATRDAYVSAMLSSNVQATVVAYLVDRLGHVPEVSVATDHDR